MAAEDRIPVIIGVGEVNDRPAPDEPGLDSVELMATAIRAADAGGGWIARCDSLASIPQISFRDYDVPAMLPEALGIAEDRIVYIGAGASAHEDNEPLARVEWTGTPGMTVALQKVMEKNGLRADDLDHVELYSCFPCVPKMARRELGLGTDRPLTVHGGLTFGGGPIGNYMTHAAAAMVRKLRKEGEYGLLYGNGGYYSHNHALILATHLVAGVSFPQDYHVQAEADGLRGPIPPAGDDYEGPAVLETYTVFFGRDGTTTHGVVIARAPDGARVLSRIDGDDEESITFLTSGAVEPVGSAGHTVRQGQMLHWRRG